MMLRLAMHLLLCVVGILLCVQFSSLYHLTYQELEQEQGQEPEPEPEKKHEQETFKFKVSEKRMNDEIKHSLSENSTNFLPRVLAIVFPQFHQDAINDRIWGRGFTGWDNLRKAPLRNRLGQQIPRPTELGYYDYTDVAPRQRHGEFAKGYGIDGLVFHHYWFYDKEYPGPNLHRPLEKMLMDGHPNVSFALHWCNKDWTNTWNGKQKSEYQIRVDRNGRKTEGLLQPQFYPASKNETIDHYNFLRQFFLHPNYIKVNGMPLLMIQVKHPAVFKMFRWLKELATEDGFKNLYFTVGVIKPHSHLMPVANVSEAEEFELMKLNRQAERSITHGGADKVFSYPSLSGWGNNSVMKLPLWCVKDGPGEKFNVKRTHDIPGIIISFDNTPRRPFDEAVIFSTGKPAEVLENFRKSFHAALYYDACCFPREKELRMARKKQDGENFVILNAMNEWEESMTLEPSDVFGYRFLEIIRDTKMLISERGCHM